MAKMKALVYYGAGDVRYEDVSRPEPGPDEVLVKVKAVSICGSDLAGYRGGNPMRVPPLIMGHEFSGEIAELGRNVTGLKIGERVGVITNLFCKTCEDCRNGLTNVCNNRLIIGTTMPAGSYNGAMAEYVVVPAEKIVPLADHVSFAEAALAEPLSISLRATKHVGDVRGKTVVVFGAGPIGLLIIACLQRAGAGNIVASDVISRRLEKAREMGATHTAGTKEDLLRLTRDLTGGTGVDCVFDAAGVEETVNAGIEAVRNGGKIILVGMASPVINFELKHAVCKEARLIGSYMYTTEMEEALEIIAQGGIDVKKIITSVHPLSEGPRIFKELASGKTEDVKVILTGDT